MSINLVQANSQYLVNTTPPITAYPYTVGLWFWIATASSYKYLWSMSEPSDFANKLALYLDDASSNINMQLQSQAAGTSVFAAASTIQINSWYYVVVRLVSATNRWLSLLRPDGSTTHSQNTTSNLPSYTTPREMIGADGSAGGPGTFYDGRIAEFFKANVDIQADGTQLQDWMLRRLAYLGPFSVPYLRKNILEYRAFRDDVTDFEEEDIFYGAGKGIQPWVKNGTVPITVAPHLPLASSYVRPGDGFGTVIV